MDTPLYTLSLEWHTNQQIVCFKLHHALDNLQDNDHFFESIDRIFQQWSPEKPWLGLFDISTIPYATWSPANRHALNRFIENTPPYLTGRNAVLTRQNLGFYLIKPLVEVELNRRIPNIQQKIFYDRKAALDWLGENIASPARV